MSRKNKFSWENIFCHELKYILFNVYCQQKCLEESGLTSQVYQERFTAQYSMSE